MMMRKILLSAFVCVMFTQCVYGASVPDDDSVPYYPYPVQPPQSEQPKPESPAPKKSAPKKTAMRKKTPAKKPATKKTASRKKAPARQTSLQKGIELMQQERYEKAKPYLLKAIQEERNNPNAWYWYGVYHEKTGGFYQAQYFYTKAVTIDPAFEPLSRVVFYPEDSEKTPLWDPKRPARVYPVETASVPMNVSRFPNAPDDPEIPKVPVYTPPEPGSTPLDGDSWNPAVYVPPSPEELTELDGQSPVYLPPDAEGVIADERRTAEISSYENNIALQRPVNDQIIADREKIMRVQKRADKPLYNPPEPGQRVAQRPAQTQTEQSRKTVSIPTKATQNRKNASVPETRVVRQSQKKSTNAAKVSAKKTRKSQTPRTTSQDVRPQTQTRTQTQRQLNQTQTQRQQTPTPPVQHPPVIQTPPETVQPQRRQNEYMPPVGQYAPDPGTISDRPIPPVGQANQN